MSHLIKFLAILAFIFLLAPILPYGYHIQILAFLATAWLATK